MSTVDKLLAAGAHSVGGDILWKHKVVGTTRNGVFQITKDGEELLALDITDVEPKAKTKPARKAKVAEPAEDAPPVRDDSLDPIDGLDDLLS